MGCHGSNDISYNQNAFILEENIFLHLSGPLEQIYTHNKMSIVFNEGLISPLDTSLPNVLPSFLSFHS